MARGVDGRKIKGIGRGPRGPKNMKIDVLQRNWRAMDKTGVQCFECLTSSTDWSDIHLPNDIESLFEKLLNSHETFLVSACKPG